VSRSERWSSREGCDRGAPAIGGGWSGGLEYFVVNFRFLPESTFKSLQCPFNPEARADERLYARAMAFFALKMVHGPNSDASRGIREQRGWDEHAAFMDGLVDDRFVILGGPIGDGQQTMLVIEATDEHEVNQRLDEDPWASMGLLQVGSIEPWTIWLDGRVTNARAAQS
jgi:uncharacterized protein YciI